MEITIEHKPTRQRNPHFPSIGLKQAEEFLSKLFEKERRAVIAREVAANDIGFSGVNGTSGRVLGALSQYGLLKEAGRGQVRISDEGVGILRPRDDYEKHALLLQAIRKPRIFGQLFTSYDDGLPSDGAIIHQLEREYDFTRDGAERCVEVLREGLSYIDSLVPSNNDMPSQMEADDYADEAKPQPVNSQSAVTISPINSVAGTQSSDVEKIEGKLSATTRAQLIITGPLGQVEHRKLQSWLQAVVVPWAEFLAEDHEDET